MIYKRKIALGKADPIFFCHVRDLQLSEKISVKCTFSTMEAKANKKSINRNIMKRKREHFKAKDPKNKFVNVHCVIT
jgi:hypothetical protein